MSQEEALVLEELRVAHDNLSWFASLSDDTLKPYAGKFVVVAKRGIVASADDVDTATSVALKHGFALSDILVDYVPAAGESWVL